MSQINFITTCTNGKHSQGYPVLNLATFTARHLPADALIHAWSQALSDAVASGPGVPVERLYKGGHWATVMSIFDKHEINLWVLSAGLGLVKQGDRVVPYQATFATGQQDSIPLYATACKGKAFHQTWWREINLRSPFAGLHPTSIAALMQSKPDEYFILCGSPDYINATAPDILAGIPCLSDPDKQLLIISSAQVCTDVKKYLLASSKDIAEWLNSNMLMLNARLAEYVIARFAGSAGGHLGQAAAALREQFAALPSASKVQGIRRTPEEVDAWLRAHLQSVPDTSASRALRAFRDGGNSFEEKRFRGRFAQAVARFR